MKQRIFSVALALCLCISFRLVAHASQEDFSLQEDVLMEESIAGLAAGDNTVPTPAEVYESMIALKDQDPYKEGTTWTDYEPYSASAGYYHWKGGPLDGKNISAVGCVAFAFILSDEAFGSLPARMYTSVNFDEIKVGDILRVNTDTHTVIVLEVNDAGIIVAEGNISTGDHKGKVHWGRAMSKDEVLRNTSHYITRYPEDYIPPYDPGANVSVANGTLTTGLGWNLTKAGTLTISGNGAMPEFGDIANQPWSDKCGQIRRVIIEDGVTNIGSCAFRNCGVLSVQIPSSVTTIGNSAFQDSSLISAAIPSGVKTIGDSAFQGCQNLSSVSLSDGLEIIRQNAFRACTSLTSINLPASIREVGAATFMECTAMRSAAFAPGSRQVVLGDNMFTRCYYLMSATLPSNIDCIGKGMFQNCQMLAGVEIPQGASSIGEGAFASSGVQVLIIPDSVTTIGMATFSACPLTDIYFTGTKAQWDRISKLGDTTSEVSKVSIHYDYVPNTPTNPDPPPTDPGPGGPGTTGPGTAVTPTVSVSYRTHVQTDGWQNSVSDGKAAGTIGRAKRLEGIRISVSGNPNLGVQYTTHIQSYGWLPWAGNGEVSGTEGEAKRLEAIKIHLTGADKDKYDIYYRVHAQSYGWMNWAKNGEPAGTEGYAKRLEAIQIQVVEKGKAMNTKAEGISSVRNEAYVTKSGRAPVVSGADMPNVAYRTHVQTYGWQGQKYNGQMSGTSGQAKRLEGICISLSNLPYSGSITYRTHVQTYGWQGWKSNGAMSGTSGESKRLEAIEIRLTGGMEQHYDVYYRVHAQSYGWLAWAKNGASAGTAGLAKRLEGIQIVLVPKGGTAPANGYGGIVSANKLAFIKK